METANERKAATLDTFNRRFAKDPDTNPAIDCEPVGLMSACMRFTLQDGTHIEWEWF